ncbi:secreted RxLR effector protein 161-like [Diprion similis]|uniref:secreted RxLR effector protein 161-like n=1 Tax=Diprion similis TaxID=362088 RepID=UPI001EF76D8F|nr:secreted RxLR effector protein 161-like [Diprion similis]
MAFHPITSLLTARNIYMTCQHDTTLFFTQRQLKIHWNAVKRILKYVKGTVDYGIQFESNMKILNLAADSEADFAGDKETRKSNSGFLIEIGKASVVWGTQKQKSTALSTTESEYSQT